MAEPAHRRKDIFLKALDVADPAERAAYLAQACGDNAGLRRQLEAMLAAHAAPDSFLEKPAAALGATIDAGVAPPSPAEAVGTRIGPYKLLQQIGEGGMGVVYMAEQEQPVRRMVALKIIKPGMDSGQVLARFEAERQALALMDHPNIARVLDAGTVQNIRAADLAAAGRPYFVMELVKGVPITQYCDERRLTPRQRLELFIPVCQAVQHAHQKGVIHRDLKPSNLLVALYDGKPVPKVIDFGVAKAMGEPLTEATLFTGFGAVVGTLAYMSPEQAELNQIDIDTRSDIYSLGVVLYELLTGSTPLDRRRLKEGAILEVLRLIREEDPPRPSTRISTANTLATLSEQRQTEPARLARLIRGDIDWIVMKALDKDRNRRYESAATLWQDIERFLHDQPVEASPPGAAYRLRKFVKRNRGAVTAGLLVLLALVGGLAAMTVGLFEARAQRDEADRARNDESAQRARAQDAEKRAVDALALAKKSEADETLARKLAEDREQTARTQTKRAESSEAEVKRQLTEAGHTLFTAQINRAAALWQHDPLQGLKVLRNHENCPHKDRDFAWHFYHRLCDVERTVFRGASGKALTSLAFSPGRDRLAAGCKDHSVLVWAYPGGALQHRLEGHAAPVSAVAFSADGKYLFSGGNDRLIQRWNVATGQADGKPMTMPGVVSGLAMRKQGKWLAASSFVEVKGTLPGWRRQQGAVILWDVETGAAKEIRTKLSDGVMNAAFTPDGKWVAAGFGIDVCVRAWDIETGKEVGHYQGANAGWVQGLSFTGDGRRLALATADLKVHLFDVANKKEPRVFEGHQHELWGVAISPNDRLVASSGWDRTVRLWDMDERWEHSRSRELMVFPGYDETPIAFTPDGRGLIAQQDGSLVELVPTLEAEAQTAAHHADGITAIAYAPNGRTLASVGMDHWLRLWDIDARDPSRPAFVDLAGFALPPRGLAYSGDGQTLFVGGTIEGPYKQHVHQVARWDMKTRQRLPAWLGHATPVTALAVSARHHLLVSGSQDGALKLWDLRTDQELAGQPALANQAVGTLAFHPTDPLLACLSHGKEGHFLTLWQVSPLNQLRELKRFPVNATGLAFTSRGKELFVGHDQGVSILDMGVLDWHSHLDTGRYIWDLRYRVDEQINPLAITPDDRTLAVGMKDRTIQLWDIPSRKLRTTLTGHVRSVTALAFRPDGKALASGDRFLNRALQWVRGGAVKLWSAEPRRPVGHDQPLDRLVFDRDGRLLSTVSTDAQILWDPNRGIERTILGREPGQAVGAALSPDGRRLVAWELGSPVNTLVVRAADTGEVLLRHEVAHAETGPPHFGPALVVWWIAGDRRYALDLDTLTPLPPEALPSAYAAPGEALAAAPDGQWLARFDDKAIHVWRWKDRRELRWPLDPVPPRRLVAIDDTRLLAFHADGKARLWNVETGRVLVTLDEDVPHGSAVSPDGQVFAAVVPEGSRMAGPAAPQGLSPVVETGKPPAPRWEVRLWNLATGKEWRPPVPVGAARQVALALTADRLLLAVDDGNVPKFLPALKYR